MDIRMQLNPDWVRNIVKGNMTEHNGKVMTGELIDNMSAVIAECLNDHLKSIGE